MAVLKRYAKNNSGEKIKRKSIGIKFDVKIDIFSELLSLNVSRLEDKICTLYQ
jgi:hypothetical protein